MKNAQLKLDAYAMAIGSKGEFHITNKLKFISYEKSIFNSVFSPDTYRDGLFFLQYDEIGH